MWFTLPPSTDSLARLDRGHLVHELADLQPIGFERTFATRKRASGLFGEVAWLMSCEMQVFYNSSKAAVSSLAKNLAAEWAP